MPREAFLKEKCNEKTQIKKYIDDVYYNKSAVQALCYIQQLTMNALNNTIV